MELTTITIKGIAFPITVSESGVFSTVFDGARIDNRTFRDLAETLEVVVKQARVKVSIPFAIADTFEIRQGVATGIHAANGAVLATMKGKNGVQLATREGRGAVRPLTDEEWATYSELKLAYGAAQQALGQWIIDFKSVEGNQLNVEQAVQAALTAGSAA